MLNSKEDGVELRGELISFEDGIYRVETVIGEIAIAADMVECSGPGCPDLTPVTPELVARPGESVTIITDNGNVRLNGTLVSFEDGAYEIDTNIGRLEILAEGTTCEGPGCPVPSIAEGAVDVVATPATAEIETEGGASVAALPLPVITDFEVAIADMDTEADAQIVGAASAIEAIFPHLARDVAPSGGAEVTLASTSPLAFEEAAAMGAPAGSLGFELPGDADAATGIIAKLATGAETGEDADVRILTQPLSDPDVDPGLRPLGVEALVPIVSRTNPVFALTQEELAGIFAGVIENWSEVGGQDRTIRVVGLAPPHDLTDAVLTHVTGPFGRSLLADIDRVPSTAQVVAEVAQDDAAIGFVNLAQAGDTKSIGVLDNCGRPVLATASSIKTGRYPFARQVFADIRSTDGLAGSLVASLDTLAADPSKAGMFPVGVSTHPLDEQIGELRDGLNSISDRVARQNASNAMRMMGLVEKLSLTFSFDDGTNRLTSSSGELIDAVLDFADQADLNEVFLVGFSESTGEVERDKGISRTAAQLVADALSAGDDSRALENTIVRTVGLGSITPVTCGEANKYANRRVEIWLRR